MASLRALGLVAAVAVALSGCTGGRNPDDFWSNAAFWKEGAATEAAMAALARGDLPYAERAAQEALKRNPRDPYALLVAARVFQATNRPDLARQYYQSLAGLRSSAQATFGVPGPAVPRTVTEIAEYNLALLEGRAAPELSGLATPQRTIAPVMAADTDQVITRFVTLRRLLDEGLVTQEEYDQRRAANLGALLPMTKPSPAAGLEVAAPGPVEIVERLKAINASLEIKAISPREHAVERSTILDGLLPAAAQKVAYPPAPPTDVLESADRLARLERMREAKVITPPEHAAEREAIIRSVEAAAKKAQMAGAAPQQLKPVDKPKETAAKGTATVHLASLRSIPEANKEWASLQAKFPELKGQKPRVQKVDLKGKGVFYRLKAGPMPAAAANQLCQTLKAKGQFCEPMPEKAAAKTPAKKAR